VDTTDKPVGQISLDDTQRRLARQDCGPVVVEGGLQRRLVEGQTSQPCLVLDRPVRPVSPDSRVAQEALGQSVPGSGEVFDRVTPGPTQVAHRLFERGRDPVATSSPARCRRARRRASRVSVLTLSPDALGIWGDDLAMDPERLEQTSQVIARGASFIAGPQT
jgi:hypothetical protein